MPPLDPAWKEFLGYALNYLVVGFTNITAEYLILRMVLSSRRSPVLWYAYFLVKFAFDAFFWYAMGGRIQVPSIALLDAVWTYVTGILSFVIVCQCFRSDMVLAGVCAVACDLFAGVVTSLSAMVANAMWGLPLNTGYLRPVGLATIGEVVIAAAAYLCLCRPICWLLRWMCRMVQRNRVVWGVAAALLISVFVITTQRLAVSTALDNHLPTILPFSFFLVLLLGASLLQSALEARRREQVVRECAELASSYDRTIRSQLEGLERGLDALDGHERVLGLLESQDDDVTMRARALREAYGRLCAGAFCECPALDAVLASGARRLRALGASPAFTVAAVPVRAAAPATVCLALLNLACEAAERTGVVEGDAVELRVRGVGEQVLFRLEVPERWGALWARRFLCAFDTRGADLMRERRQGDRRVVLVMSEGVVS